MGQRTLTLEMGYLTFCDGDGNVIGTYKASTGKWGETDPTKENVGPCPPGTYTLYPSEISGGTVLSFIERNIQGNWGIYRAPLHPNAGTDTYNRDGLFLHGGIWNPYVHGSAGCINVGTPWDKELFDLIKQSDDSILVIVSKYPNEWSAEPAYDVYAG
ncbi:hypothetical protein Ga0466249_001510 [Sporomusaceae bacterium BoRhaA]|uniref:L,D-transpeptidase n=1 Tax=Pelorhabdus rhamnosifermentans TaxID=2772457 RepID=UPI001C0640DA|nr:L,D-transpeptidase [Pelorhabdus rhamnosifermentans]MBU2700418.1 hypothetical protein [Pelorhabdus rhamnosifermentans]